MKVLQLTCLFALLFSFSACDDDDDTIDIFDRDEPNGVVGLNYVEAENGDFSTIYNNVINALNGVDAIGIVAEVDHASNAANAGLTLQPTKVIMFGNPMLGTPLMQANQRAGLDLPQKMLVYQAADDDIILAYNNTQYLGRRHGVENVATLAQIGDALGNFAMMAGDDNVVNANDNDVRLNEGIVLVSTELSVDTVYNRLIAAIDGNPNVNVIAELDHQANAARVNLDLRPTKLVVFGNPALGTPLMQDERSIAIDLPQKMLIYQDADGTTKLIYNDPAYLADRHDVDDDLAQIATITMALQNFAAAATTN